MKRKLFVANLALLGLVAYLGFHLRRDWLDAEAREQAVLQKAIKPIPPPPLTPLPITQTVKAAGYIDIAQKDLFTKDRNPVVIIEPPPPPKKKPMPPLPLYHGRVDLGDGPMAIMSENAKAPHRDYQPGDNVGPFKLISFDSEEIVLEWEGETITKRVDEMLDRSVAPAPAAPGPVVAAAAAPPSAAARPAPPPGEPKPGNDVGGHGVKTCQAGDKSPAGTVADGMRKVIKTTPFGPKCYWEPSN